MGSKRFISIVGIMMVCWAFASMAVGQPGLVAYWPLDEGNGTIAADVFYGNDGTLVNGPSWMPGKFGNCLSFDGTDQRYVNLPPGFVVAQAGSISMWIMTTQNYQTLGHHGHIFWASQTDGDGYGDQLELHVTMRGGSATNNGQVNFYTEAGATDITITSPNPYNNGQWHHVVATWDRAANCVLYIDGAAVRQASYATAPNVNYSGMVRLGAPGSTLYTRYYSGLIDEVRFFNRALTAAEATTLFNTIPTPLAGVVIRTLPLLFSPGVPVPVRLTAAPRSGGQIVVNETLPAGLVPGNPVASAGTVNVSGQSVTWTVALGATTETLTYDATPQSGGCDVAYTITGTYDAGPGWSGHSVSPKTSAFSGAAQ